MRIVARRTAAAEEANLNEQIGNLKANKMKWQETLREAISETNSRTAEKRSMEEQRRDLEKAYKFQMGECAKQIKTRSLAEAANLIKQIGTLKASRTKCQESREKEEQRRQVEKAYKFQMGECAKQIRQVPMKCQEMRSEALSEPLSRIAEKREMEEQRRQMERAYKFQM